MQRSPISATRKGLALLLAAVGLCTLHKLANRPVWDDLYLLEQASKLHAQGAPWRVFSTSTLALVLDNGTRALEQPIDLYRPFTLLSFYAGYAWGAGLLVVQHLINTLLHLSCVSLVYLHARRLLQDARAALFAAAWFGLAPLLTEAHVWISGRFDLLSTACGLLALWLLVLGRDAGRTRVVQGACELAAGGAFSLGLLAKEPLLFTLPAIALWPSSALGVTWRARLRTLLPLLIASVLYLALRAHVLSGVAGLELSSARLRALANAPVLLLDAALNVVVPLWSYPRALNEDYAAIAPLGQALCALLLLALCALLFRVRARARVESWSALWFSCTLAPVALTTTEFWPGFGRHVYLPWSIGVIGAVAAGARAGHALAPYLRVPRVLTLFAYAYLGLLLLRSHVAVYDWADEATLFASIARAAPERSHGHGMLGVALINQRRYAEAVPELARAHALAPNQLLWASRLGTALLFAGQKQAALALAEHELVTHPDAPEPHLLAAYATLDSDQAASARHVLECLLHDPNNVQCGEALAFIRSKHPNAARFRLELDRLFAQPRWSALAGRLPH